MCCLMRRGVAMRCVSQQQQQLSSSLFSSCSQERVGVVKQPLVVHVGVLGGGGRDMVAPVWPERMNSGGEGSEAADVISAMGSCIPFGQLLFARTLATQVAVCLLFFLLLLLIVSLLAVAVLRAPLCITCSRLLVSVVLVVVQYFDVAVVPLEVDGFAALRYLS